MILQGDELKRLFRENLKARRAALGLSQEAVAKRIGAHQPYVAALESGERSPTLDMIARLGDALEVDPNILLLEEILSETS